MPLRHLHSLRLSAPRRINEERNSVPLPPQHPLSNNPPWIFRRPEENYIADGDPAVSGGDTVDSDDVAGEVDRWEHAGAEDKGEAADVVVNDVDGAGSLGDEEDTVGSLGGDGAPGDVAEATGGVAEGSGQTAGGAHGAKSGIRWSVGKCD